MPQVADILALISLVARDPAGDWSTARLARRAGWSEAHLHRAFRRVAQETPKSLTTRLKLTLAVARLRSGVPAGRAAAEAGFASHEVLARTFRRELGRSPSEIGAHPVSSATEHAACLCLYHLSIEPRRPLMSTDPVTVTTRDPQPVLLIRRRVPASQLQPALAECLPAVFLLCQRRGYPIVGAPFTRYLEMSRGQFTIEAGIPIGTSGAAGEGEIESSALPGGEVAVAVHAGPYDTLGETHARLEQWAAAHSRATGAPWESYLTDPGDHPDPADWRTEVVLPLLGAAQRD